MHVLSRPPALPGRTLHPDRLMPGAACLVAVAATIELLTREYAAAAWTGLVALLLVGLGRTWLPARHEHLDVTAALLGALALAIGTAHGGLG